MSLNLNFNIAYAINGIVQLLDPKSFSNPIPYIISRINQDIDFAPDILGFDNATLKSGQALSLDGSNDFINAGNQLSFGAEKFTWSIWFKTNR